MADGPEAFHAELTSGDPAATAAAVDACSSTIRVLADAIDLIVIATDQPAWDSSEASEAFNLRAWATRAAAQAALIRVNRCSLAVQMAADAYATTVDSADDVIQRWRRTKRSDLSGDVVSLARSIALINLIFLRFSLNARLGEAIDFVQAEALTGDLDQWRTTGLIKSMLHDLNSPNDFGPAIPNTLATGDDDGGWTPQGLGYDPDSDPPTLLQASYSGSRSQLATMDPETGEQLGFVGLGGWEGGAPPDHGGGVTVHEGRVNVMSSGSPAEMYSYSLEEIRGAAPGQGVDPLGAPVQMAGGAYSTIDGDTLYVGTFEEDRNGQMTTYSWNRTTSTWDEQATHLATPPKIQGAAIVDGQIVFSTSSGRGNDSHLQSYRVDDVLAGHGAEVDHRLGAVTLPSMAEGVVAVDGTGLITTYESGSASYTGPKGEATLEDLWASQAMTITPLSALGMSGGTDVVPVTLEQASTGFESGSLRLSRAATSIDDVALPAGCMGSNTNGDAFAAAITTHCDETSQWIGESRISATTTADGLVTSASSYVAADQAVRDALDSLRSWLGGS